MLHLYQVARLILEARAASGGTMAIASLCTTQMADLGRLSFANKQAYCRKYGYGFVGAGDTLDASRPASWSKIILVRECLEHFEWVFWSDADSVIVNDQIPLTRFVQGRTEHFIVGRDFNGINCGQFFLRRSPQTIDFLNRVYAQPDLIYHYWWEQAAIVRLLETGKAGIDVCYAPHFAFNCSPENFRDGDFLVHVAGGGDRLKTLQSFLDGTNEMLAPPPAPQAPFAQMPDAG
ncbi:MAG: hypothetical protein ABR964_13675 [Tepidisphaeraceae bacterium]|jgi:hypothetical protein